MGVALGLAAAFWWGATDYFAAMASRRLGARYVVLGFHVLATVALAALAVATDALGGIGGRELALAALAGAFGWTSYLAFYRALAIGPISVVSPIVSGYAATTVVLAVVVLGDRPDAAQTVAIVLSLVGVAVAATDGGRAFHGAGDRSGMVLGVVAMVLVGCFVFVVASQSPDAGWLQPLFLGRAFATGFLLVQTLVLDGPRLPPAPARTWLAVAFVGTVDTLGYVCFNLGVRYDATAIVGAASAPYAVVPIVVGIVVLRERPTVPEWIGVLLTIVGVVLLGIVSG